MTKVFEAAADLQGFVAERRWKFCFIGGLALLRWGEPRETLDADLTLLAGMGTEELFIEPLLKRFVPRIDNAAHFAIFNRVLLLQADNHVGLDVAMGALPFEERAVERASDYEFPGGIRLRTCQAEDLVVMKAFASRPKDWIDLEGILVRQCGKLNWDLIWRELRPLAIGRDTPEIVDELEKRRRALEV